MTSKLLLWIKGHRLLTSTLFLSLFFAAALIPATNAHAQLRELCAATYPGPWYCNSNGQKCRVTYCSNPGQFTDGFCSAPTGCTEECITDTTACPAPVPPPPAQPADTVTFYGTVFNDLNENGVKDPGEPNLDGWPIRRGWVLGCNPGPEVTTSSTGDRNYTLTFSTNSVPAGCYSDPGDITLFDNTGLGYQPTTLGISGYSYAVNAWLQRRSVIGSGQTTFRVDWPMKVPNNSTLPNPSTTVTVYGSVFNDLNGNGVKDAGEPNLDGWPIQPGYLQPAGSRQCLGTPITSTTTRSDGSNYSFTLDPNAQPCASDPIYITTTAPDENWTSTTTQVWNYSYAPTKWTSSIHFQGTTARTQRVDFPLKPLQSTFGITGSVYVDTNHDGICGRGESLYTGNTSVTITAPVAGSRTISVTNGQYRYDMQNGADRDQQHTVTLAVPSGYTAYQNPKYATPSTLVPYPMVDYCINGSGITPPPSPGTTMTVTAICPIGLDYTVTWTPYIGATSYHVQIGSSDQRAADGSLITHDILDEFNITGTSKTVRLPRSGTYYAVVAPNNNPTTFFPQ